MKLTEALSPPNSLSDCVHNLVQSGWRMIGKGEYGVVLEKDNLPYVLKVFSSEDIAFLAFIEMAQNHPNQHFPKFIGKLLNVTSKFKAIRLERLTEIPWMSDRCSYFIMNTEYYMQRKNLTSKPTPEMEDVKDWLEEKPELKQACDLIADELLPKFNLDLKFGNVMLRGKTYVFSDPIKFK